VLVFLVYKNKLLLHSQKNFTGYDDVCIVEEEKPHKKKGCVSITQ